MAGQSLRFEAFQFNGEEIKEPQRAWLFDVRLPSIGAPIPAVESVDTGYVFENIQTSPEGIGGRHKHHAILKDAQQLILTMYHDQDTRSAGFMTSGHTPVTYVKKWMSKIQNEDGTFDYPVNYKYPIYLDFQNVDKSVGCTVLYKGCFPISVGSLPMTYGATNQRTRLSVTFSVDRIIPQPSDIGQGSAKFTMQRGPSEVSRVGEFPAIPEHQSILSRFNPGLTKVFQQRTVGGSIATGYVRTLTF